MISWTKNLLSTWKMRNWIHLDQLPQALPAFQTLWHGKNMIRETLTDTWAITDSQSCEANFSLECMHELNPHWLKVQKKKSSRSFGHGNMQWGSYPFCGLSSSAPRQQTSHPSQTQGHSFWCVPECLERSITRFFFKLIFSHQLWTFFTLSVPSYPFPENRKNWGEMSPLYVVLTHVHLQDLPAFIDLLLTKLKLKTPLTVPSPRRWVMPRKEAPSHWRQPL